MSNSAPVEKTRRICRFATSCVDYAERKRSGRRGECLAQCSFYCMVIFGFEYDRTVRPNDALQMENLPLVTCDWRASRLRYSTSRLHVSVA